MRQSRSCGHRMRFPVEARALAGPRNSMKPMRFPMLTRPMRMILSKTPSFPTPRSILAGSAVAGGAIAVVLAVLGGMALAQQDKYTLQVPNGSRSPSSGDTKAGRLSPSVTAKSCSL